jgi:hypothetical protein
MTISQIHEEEQLLNELGLDMSLRDVKERGEEVIFKMIEH